MDTVDVKQPLRKSKQKSNNVYVPPPARKTIGQEQTSFERTTSCSRANAYDETKACNDSSLLFLNDKGHSYSVQQARRYKQKSKRQIKKINQKDNEVSAKANLIVENSSAMDLMEPAKTSAHTKTSNCVVMDKTNQKSDFDSTSSNSDDNIPSLIIHNSIVNHDSKEETSGSVACPEEAAALILEKVKNICLGNSVIFDDCKKKQGDITNIINGKIIRTEADPLEPDGKLLTIEHDDWESLYNESGDCLATDTVQASKKWNSKKKVTVNAKDVHEEENNKQEGENRSSIIEIYGFPPDLKTSDLMTLLSAYTTRGLKLSWVDDTHALGIFPSPMLADELLACDLPLVRTRPLSQGTLASQEKARTLVLPSSLRPKTCTAMARRLVSGALGLKVSVTPEARAAEKEILRQAREEKKLAAKQRNAAWEGVFDRNVV